jgi:hypothetical protein
MQEHIYRARYAGLVASAMVSVLTGCSVLQTNPELAAFSAQMTGANQVPPVATAASGRLYAVLNKESYLLRWKLTYSGLKGAATVIDFHGPALIGANASSVLAFKGLLKSPAQGQATLSPAQAADLLTGKWYANIHTAARPNGEIRGQMILQE